MKVLMIDDKKIQCLICNKSVKNLNGLSQHLKIHNLTSTEYTIKFILHNIEPLCKCGCNEKTKIDGYYISEYKLHHNPANYWQLKYDKNSPEFNNIVKKISNSVTEYAINNPRIVTEETRKKLSDKTKLALSDPEEIKRRTDKMKKTKQQQSEQGILSKNHWINTWPQNLVDEKLKEIGEKISKTKRNKNIPAWNLGLTQEDVRVGKWSGENNYRYNPNKLTKYHRKFYNKEYRNKLLTEQNFICFKCKIEDGRQLCLHHVDENKNNNEYENLIFLCRSCHMRIHNIPKYLKDLQVEVIQFKEIQKGE